MWPVVYPFFLSVSAMVICSVGNPTSPFTDEALPGNPALKGVLPVNKAALDAEQIEAAA